MLSKIIELKEVFPEVNSLPEYYQHLLQAEALFNHSPFTVKQHKEARKQLKQAHEKLNQARTEEDKSFYHLLNGIAFNLTSWITNDSKNDAYAQTELSQAEALNSNLSNIIKSLHHYFKIFEFVFEQHDDDSDEDDHFEATLDSYLVCTTAIFQAFRKISHQNYYISNRDLTLILDYLDNREEKDAYINSADAKNHITIIQTLLQETNCEHNALQRDKSKHGEKNNELYKLFEQSQPTLEEFQFIKLDEIHKKCSDYIEENEADPFLKIQAITMRAYSQKLLSIVSPLAYNNRQFTSDHLFNSALKLCQFPEEVEYVNDKKSFLSYFALAFRDALDYEDPVELLTNTFELSCALLESSKCYSLDSDEIDIENPENKSILLDSKAFYQKQSSQHIYNHFIDFQLSAISRLLQDETAFMLHFVNFLSKLQLANKVPSEYKNYKEHSKAIYLNVLFFLTICQNRKTYSAEALEKIKNLILNNEPTIHIDIYDLAFEFSNQGLTTLSILLINIGLLIEGINFKQYIMRDKYIATTQTQLFKDRLWDESIYTCPYIYGSYIELLAHSHVCFGKKAIDLNTLFKDVMPNITQKQHDFLTESQVAQCEIIILHLTHSEDESHNYIGEENCVAFKGILELLFVSKLAHHLASKLLTESLNSFQSLENDFKTTFPAWGPIANTFFKNILLTLPLPSSASASQPSVALASEVLEKNENTPAAAKKKAKRRKQKNSIKAPVFPDHFRQTVTPNLSKTRVDDKIPDHIGALIEEQIHKTNNTLDALPEPAKKSKKINKAGKSSRRKAIQQPAASASSVSAAPANIQEEQSSDSEIETSMASLNVQASAPSHGSSASSLEPANIRTIVIPPTIEKFISLLKKWGSQRTSIVGGYVRNTLLRKESSDEYNDYDIVTDLSIELIKREAPTLFTKESRLEDYACVSFEGINIDLKFSSHLADKALNDLEAYQQDAKTRDFTCNALYANEKGEVYDPLEKGIESLKEAYLVSIIDIEESFRIDPIRMFRAIYATTSRQLEFSDEMQYHLPKCAEASKAYFLNPNHLTRINSTLYKLLCQSKGNAALNFEHLEMFGFINILFPALGAIFQKNSHFKAWFISELENPPAQPSINYIYAMFILGHLLENQAGGKAIVCDPHFITNTLFVSMPLLGKNFEKWPFGYVVNIAVSRWQSYNSPHVTQSSSPAAYTRHGFYHHRDHRAFTPQTSSSHSESAPPPSMSPRPASLAKTQD